MYVVVVVVLEGDGVVTYVVEVVVDVYSVVVTEV